MASRQPDPTQRPTAALEHRVRMLSGADAWHTVAGRNGSPPQIFMADGPHGLRVEKQSDGSSPFSESHPATCFPPAATLACSWDPDLIREVGGALGREARAVGLQIVLGPGLNIKRHPHCGRNFEYLSEDPLLSGVLSKAMVEGIQGEGVGACLKHFAVNNQESNRFVVDAIVDERTLREIYLTGFEIALAANPSSVMAAYNKVNGQNACENAHLLVDILRGEWGYDGLVMSDWGAVNSRIKGLQAGLDLEMPGNQGINDKELLAALEAGEITRSQIDTAIGRLTKLADIFPGDSDAGPDPDPGTEAIASQTRSQTRSGTRSETRSEPWSGSGTVADGVYEQNHELAARASAHSIVLLKNDGVLPLRATPSSSLSVIGAFAEAPRYQGAGSSKVNPTRIESLLDAISAEPHGFGVRYVPGYDPVASEPDEAAISRAVDVARETDVAIVMVGLPDRYESEGFDRLSMALPPQHDRLVNAVCDVNPNTIVVLSNGSPVEMPWVDRPVAIVEAYLGGQASGLGLWNVLTGSVNPSGRLAETFPLRSSDAPSDRWFPGQPRQVQYREGVFVGYRYYATANRAVRFPFGHGLSYTTFDYGPIDVGQSRAEVYDPGSLTAGFGPDAAAALTLNFEIANTGDTAGAEVVQVYVHSPSGPVPRPELTLGGFTKVTLEPGESASVAIDLPARAFSHYDRDAGRWAVEPGQYEVRVGASSADIRQAASIDIVVPAETDPSSTSVESGPAPAVPAEMGPVAEGPATVAEGPSPATEGPTLLAESDSAFERLLGHRIPEPEPTRPFHRNSRLLDLGEITVGRALLKIIERGTTAQVDQIAGGDPVMADHMRQSGMEMPLRGLAQLAGGRVRWPMVDALIRTLNVSPSRTLRGLSRLRRPRRRRSPRD